MTPNSSVDRTVVVEELVPGAVLRTDLSRSVAGGKGMNVARSLRALDTDALAVGMAGGRTGALAIDLAAEEGLAVNWVSISGETRTCLVVVGSATGVATVINEVGPEIEPGEWAAFHDEVTRLSSDASAVCLSGSLPPGVTDERYCDLIAALVAGGVRVFVDVNGSPLVASLAARPTGIKINALEATELVGGVVSTLAEAADAAQRLRDSGVEQVVITVGKAGAALACHDGVAVIEAPEVPTVSAVGSGDAFLAGYVAAQVAGLSPHEALTHGVASGAANATSPWGGGFAHADYLAALARVGRLQEVAA